ncbi:MAG: hypothetical protein M3Q19_02865 [Pseudomonadota bacterium]|nr:hypothetical protein [Pseudomonadota bacterium]
MTEQIALTIASVLIVATMLVHSMLGQRRIIRPLLVEGTGVMQKPLARFIVPFAWHLTSFIGLIVAATLFAWAWAPDQARTIGLAMTGVVFTVGGIWDAIGSKGQHVGWPPLTMIGLLALAALIFG